MNRLRLGDLVLVLLFFNGIASTLDFNLGIQTGHRHVTLAIALAIAAFVLYCKSKEIQIKVLLGLSFLGNEPFLLFLPIIMLPKFLLGLRFQRRVTLSQFGTILFVFYAAILIVVSNMVEAAILNTGLWFVTFGAHFFIYLYYSQCRYSKESIKEILNYAETLVLLQVLVMIVQAVIHWDFQPGDSWTGTSGNAVLAGFFCVGLLIVYFFPPFLKLSRASTKNPMSRKILVGLLLLLLLYFNDSKMVILVFGVGLVVFSGAWSLVSYLVTGQARWFWKLTLMFLLSLALWILIGTAIRWYSESFYKGVELAEVLSPYLEPELNEANSNGKAVIYHRVFVDMLEKSKLSWIFGIGPARLGSKAANIMAYDVLYKEEGTIRMPAVVPAYSSHWARLYMGDLWTKEIAETSKFRSATLSFPFAGLVTIKAEYGLLGIIFFIFFLGTIILELTSKVQRSDLPIQRWGFFACLFWFSLPLHMVFDNFQEKSYIILPMLLLTAVLTSVQSEEDQGTVLASFPKE